MYKDVKIINAYTTNNKTPKLSTIWVIRGKIDNSTITIGDFKNTLSLIDRIAWSKISNVSQHIIKTINQLDLTDISRKLYSVITEYTFFSNTHGTFSGIKHRLDHKSQRN